MAVTLRYSTEFGKPALQKTICGGIYARVCCILVRVVQCRRKESSRSLSHLMMSFWLLLDIGCPSSVSGPNSPIISDVGPKLKLKKFTQLFLPVPRSLDLTWVSKSWKWREIFLYNPGGPLCRHLFELQQSVGNVALTVTFLVDNLLSQQHQQQQLVKSGD